MSDPRVITDSTMSYVFRATAELHNAGKLSTPDRTLAVRLACSGTRGLSFCCHCMVNSTGDTTALTAMATLIASARSFDVSPYRGRRLIAMQEQANQLSMYLTGVQQASSMAQGPWQSPNVGGPYPSGYYRQQSPPGQPYRPMDLQSTYPQHHFNNPQPSTAMTSHVPYHNQRAASPNLHTYIPQGGSGSAGGVISPSSDESGRQPSPGLSPAASPSVQPLYMTGFCGNLPNDAAPQLWEPRARRLAPDEYPPLVLEPMRSCSPSSTPPLPNPSPHGTPVPYQSPHQPSNFETIARVVATKGVEQAEVSESETTPDDGDNS